MAQKFDNDIFYHYTDFQALDGILRRAQLRVNNVLNMNDAAEMRLFMSGLCQAVVKRLLADGEKDLADEVRQLFEEELKKEFFYSAYAACFPSAGRTRPSGSGTGTGAEACALRFGENCCRNWRRATCLCRRCSIRTI